jgi:hypothetical protein
MSEGTVNDLHYKSSTILRPHASFILAAARSFDYVAPVSMRITPKHRQGEMPEWLNGAVSKTVVRLASYRGFESLSLRHIIIW